MELTITFAEVRCVCGVERQAALGCPGCGRESGVDPNVERRRAIVRGAAARDSVDEAEPVDLGEAFAAIDGWLDRSVVAFAATGEGSVEDAAGRLCAPLEELDMLQARVAQARRLRPDHVQWATIDGVLCAFTDVRDRYLDALLMHWRRPHSLRFGTRLRAGRRRSTAPTLLPPHGSV